MKSRKSLYKAYSNFKKRKTTKTTLLGMFRLAMPEIVYRTTKLEGESVTRKMVNALFK